MRHTTHGRDTQHATGSVEHHSEGQQVKRAKKEEKKWDNRGRERENKEETGETKKIRRREKARNEEKRLIVSFYDEHVYTA